MSAAVTVLEFRPFVRSMARRLARQLSWEVGPEDLEQSGMVGLVEAWRAFDAARGVEFPKFAWPRIHGAMIDCARSYLRGRRRTTSARGRARFVEIDEVVIRAREEHAPDELCIAHEALEQALALVRTLSPIERALVERHYFGNEHLSSIAAELGISKSWATRLQQRAVERLRRRAA